MIQHDIKKILKQNITKQSDKIIIILDTNIIQQFNNTTKI